MTARRLRVAVADDSVLVRQGAIRMLEDARCEVVGEAGDAAQLLALVARERPDVAVVDIRMPPTHTTEGVDAAGEIRRRFPATAVLVLSQYLEPRYAARVLEEAATGLGYLLKDSVSRPGQLGVAAWRVAEGWSNAAIAEQLVLSRRTVEAHVAAALAKLGIPEAPDLNRRVRLVLAHLQDRGGDG